MIVNFNQLLEQNSEILFKNSNSDNEIKFINVNIIPDNVPDDYPNNTVLLLHMNGTNGSQDFVDSSINNFQLTAFGDAQISTGVKKFGTGAGYFDGDGDYLQLISTDAFNFYNSDFTIEVWIYSTTNQTGGGIISTRNASVYSPWELQIGFPYNNQISLLINNNGGWYGSVFYGDTIIPQNEWVHLTWVCQSSNHTVYVNGVADPSLTNLNAPIIEAVAQPENIYIGIGGDGAFTGYIDDLRVTKGIARYTSNFTPLTHELSDPSDPNIEHVSLLLHMNGTNGSQDFVDSSINNFTITANGDAQISTAEKKFGSAAGYFDGDGDYLEVPSSSNLALGSGDFTVEYWIYPEIWGGDDAVLGSPNSNSFSMGTDGSVNFGVANSFIGWELTGPAPDLNQWSHVAVTRQSGYMRIFINGIITAQDTIATSYNTPITSLGGLEGLGWSWFKGYIDELRITKGVARYTANFVPQTAPFANQPPPPIPTGHIAFWKLDDTSDSSANANNLNNSANVQFVAGKMGNCAEFDQTNYLQNNSLSPTFNPNGPAGEFTISCWVYPHSFSNYQAFLGSETNGFIIHTDSGGSLYCNEAGSGDAIISSILQLNQWQHIVFVKSLDGNTRVWYNGTKVYDNITSNINNYQPRTNIMLGNFGSATFPYDGKLDMVGLWNRELTEQEIQTLYNNGNGSEP